MQSLSSDQLTTLYSTTADSFFAAVDPDLLRFFYRQFSAEQFHRQRPRFSSAAANRRVGLYILVRVKRVGTFADER